MRPITVRELFMRSKAIHWSSTVQWLAYVLFGSLVPVWGEFFVYLLFGEPITAKQFVSNGEFFLYTCSFVVPSLYLLSKARSADFALRPLWQLVGLGLLLLSGLMFGSLALLSAKPSGTGLSINDSVLMTSSMALLLTACAFIFCTHFVDCVYSNTDFRIGDEQAKLETNFDSIEEEDA